MTKTKSQLRAEAVERLEDTQLDTGSAVKKLAMAVGSEWNPPSVNHSLNCLKSRLIYLLTDDGTDNGTCPNADRTCPNDNGTASIAPNGDALHELRNYANDVRYDYNALDDVFEPDERLAELCGHVADMVERERDEARAELRNWQDGYYLAKLTEAEEERDGWKKVAKQWETNCDELRGENDALREWKACYERMRAERDELKAKLDDRDRGIAELVDANRRIAKQRDEWKAKAERLSEVRASADDGIIYGFEFCGEPDSTMLGETVFDYDGEPIGWIVAANGPINDGVTTNLEWLVNESSFGGECAMAMYHCLLYLPNKQWNSAEGFKEWLASPHNGTNGIPSDSPLDAQSRAEIEDAERSRAVSGDLPQDADVDSSEGAKAAREPREDARDTFRGSEVGSEVDTREKLEAEVRQWIEKSSVVFKKASEIAIIGLLDRQAEITRAELQAERDQYRENMLAQARRVGELMAERDLYREKLGRAVDAAHEIAKMMED